jgi:hypothetical protein
VFVRLVVFYFAISFLTVIWAVAAFIDNNIMNILTGTGIIKFIIPILAWGVRSLPEDSNSGSSGGSELSAKQRHDMDWVEQQHLVQ